MHTNHEISLCLNSYEARTATLHGRPHLIVPAVLLLPGSHCGSGGPLLYTEEALSRHASSWSGRPVTIGHPSTGPGEYVSATSSPDLFERVAIGTIFNARWEGRRLKADLWIDQTKAPASVLAALRAGMPMEISTGLFSTDEYTSGTTADGQTYEAIVKEIIPDHCAILLTETGA